jgi:hypothetical protein
MRHRSLLLALLTAVSAPAAALAVELSLHEPPARLEVLAGRGSAALPSSVLRLEGGSPVQQFTDPLHFELAPASRARVGWSGLGSLLLEGRTVVEWKAPSERGGVMRWTFVEVDRASLEVRRGRVHLELPGGWRGLLQPGAYVLEGLAGGPVEFRHDAGLPVTFWPPAGQEKARPPYTVLAGSAVRLLGEAPRPLTLPGSTSPLQEPHAKLGFESRPVSATFPAWRGFAWPWKRVSEARSPATQPAAVQPVRGPAIAEPLRMEGRGPLGEPVAPAPDPAVAEEDRGAPSTPAPGAGKQSPPAEPALVQLPAPFWDFVPVRNEGVLVLTAYGPRWVDVAEVLSQLRQPVPTR